MSEESISALRDAVIECRKNYPRLIDKRYEGMYKLKDQISFKKAQTHTPKELPNLNWPENLDWKTPESVVDEKMLAKIKEQIKLMTLIQKEEKHPISKIINSVCKNNK